MTNLSIGVLCSLISALALALMGLCFKLINTNISSYEKLLSRGIGLFIVAYFLVKRAQKKNHEVKLLGHRNNALVLILRSFAGGLAMLLYIYSVNIISLADADMMVKLNSVILLILCAIFLKEKVTLIQALVVVVSLIGVALIIKPTFSNPDIWAYIAGLAGTFLVSIAYMCIRYLTTKQNGEHPATIMFHLSCFIIVCMIYPTITNWQGFTGNEFNYLLLVLSSIFSAIGQFALTYSFKYAPAKEISIYSYTSLIWNFIFGFIIFTTFPDWLAVIGYCIIVGASIYLFIYNKNRQSPKEKFSSSTATVAATTPVFKPESLNFNDAETSQGINKDMAENIQSSNNSEEARVSEEVKFTESSSSSNSANKN
ncbi:DMT family transporter [Psittacicella hinzii]|uniref:EamA domain-containing protein n=1 Tax=Psittacicella hinzii TaxID=2028575 RepID=A0A3A1YLH3_9GAMM|nr:DMT family transporter [Psittacicella hinzii]RIY38515.1 hypothetical protein CKF58_04130 [Psittacicella hinzii]